MIEALTSIGPVANSAVSSLPAAKADLASSPIGDFGTMMSDLIRDASGALKNAESISVAGIQGKAGVQQVAESLLAAERSLQTAVAVRDRMVSALQEISRMQI